MSFVLAHLSDPHLGPLPRVRLRELAGKRALGYLNWHRGRKRLHRADVLERIVADMKAQTPDHIAVTGDLVNIALPGEFAPSRVWLDTLGDAQDVTFVPGNHDFYVRKMAREPHSHWGDFMRGDNDQPDHFPFIRKRGPISIVGLSSAIPTPAFMATGALGELQLERAARLLARLGEEGAFRVVLIHHPPRTKAAYSFKRLLDGKAFRDVLARYGAELVLHGHDHVHSVQYLDGPVNPVVAVGVPSASIQGGEADPAAYNLYVITGGPGAWRCEVISRGFRRGIDEISELTRRDLFTAKAA